MTSTMVQNTFLFFLIISVLLRFYLSFRQTRIIKKHRNAVPDEFAKTITLPEHQKAADYTCAKHNLSRIDIVIETILLIALTWGGGLDYLSEISQKLSAKPLTQGVILILLFIIVSFICSLPSSIYRTFYQEARFGFNNTTPAIFITDNIKAAILLLIIGVPLLYAVLSLMFVMGELWWFYVWCLWLAFSLTMLWVYPKWIAPIFNKFTPLEDEILKQRINALLQRTGFKSNGLFIMDGSKRSGHGNAYFTGLGKNKRIVFFDTLIKNLSYEETEAVLAHELGHFHHHHIMIQIVLNFALGLFWLWLLGKVLPQTAFYNGLGVEHISHAMALLLFSLVLPVLLFIFTPLSSVLSRRNEYQADEFAAKHSNAQDLINALIKLYRDNAGTLVCDKIYSLFYDSHPNANDRINALKKQINK